MEQPTPDHSDQRQQSAVVAGAQVAAAPATLVQVVAYGKPFVLLRADAAAGLQRMIEAARADGIAAPLLLPVSGYRALGDQQRRYADAVLRHGQQDAHKWVARPGFGAHETGRAVDLWLGEGTCDSAHVDALRKTEAWRWLQARAIPDFGFFPYLLEPWHFEWGWPHDFLGQAVAEEIARGRAAGVLT